MTRVDLFHGLPGVWQEGDFYDVVWAQMRQQVERGTALNKSERLVLLELLDRLAASPQARKALGIRLKRRTTVRNERMVDLYCSLRFTGEKHAAAALAVEKAFPKVGMATVRAVIQSNKWVARGRTRAIAASMLEKKYPKK